MAEKATLLTNLIQQGHSHEEANRTGDAIKTYEEIIKYPLPVDEILEEAVRAKE